MQKCDFHLMECAVGQKQYQVNNILFIAVLHFPYSSYPCYFMENEVQFVLLICSHEVQYIPCKNHILAFLGL